MTEKQGKPTVNATTQGSNRCDELRAQLPAYALGVMDDAERANFESRMAECPELAGELASYAALTQALHYTAPPAEPAADLGARILAAAAAPNLRVVMPESKPAPSAQPRAGRSSARAWQAAFAVAAAAAVLLALFNIYWIGQVNSLQREQALILARLSQRESAFQLAMATDSQRIDLAGENNIVLASLIYSAGGELALLQSDELAPLGAAQTYQLWLIPADAAPVSAGLLSVDAFGETVYVFTPPAPLPSFAAVGISVEPAGGSDAPTTTPIAVGQISAA